MCPESFHLKRHVLDKIGSENCPRGCGVCGSNHDSRTYEFHC